MLYHNIEALIRSFLPCQLKRIPYLAIGSTTDARKASSKSCRSCEDRLSIIKLLTSFVLELSSGNREVISLMRSCPMETDLTASRYAFASLCKTSTLPPILPFLDNNSYYYYFTISNGLLVFGIPYQ